MSVKRKKATYLPRGSSRIALGIRLRPDLHERLRATGNISQAIEEAVDAWLAQSPKTAAPMKAAARAGIAKAPETETPPPTWNAPARKKSARKPARCAP